MHALTAFYALVLAQVYTAQGYPVHSSEHRSRASTTDALSNASTFSNAAANPTSTVNGITCDIFGMHITDAQQALADVQSGALQPPLSCDCTVDTFTSLIEQCIGDVNRRHSKITSRPNGVPGGQGSSGSGSSGQPNTYQPFQSVSSSKASSNASPPPPPSTDGDNSGNPNSGSGSGNPAPGQSTHENVATNNSPAPPSSDTPAADSQQASEPSSTNSNGSSEANVSAPTNSDNVNDNNTAATPAAGNPDSSTSANDAPQSASASNANSDSGHSFNPSKDDSNKSDNVQNGSSPGPATSTGSSQVTDSAPNAASTTGNGFGTYNGFAPNSAIASNSAPAGSAYNANRLQKPVRPSSPSSGGCEGVTCLAQNLDLPGAPIPAGAPVNALSGAGSGLVGGMGSCPSGDIALCLDAQTGQ